VPDRIPTLPATVTAGCSRARRRPPRHPQPTRIWNTIATMASSRSSSRERVYQTYFALPPVQLVDVDVFLFRGRSPCTTSTPITGRSTSRPPSHQRSRAVLRDLLFLPAQARLRPSRGCPSGSPLNLQSMENDLLRPPASSAREGASTSARSRSPLRLSHARNPGVRRSLGKHEPRASRDVRHVPSVEASNFAKDLDDGERVPWYTRRRTVPTPKIARLTATQRAGLTSPLVYKRLLR